MHALTIKIFEDAEEATQAGYSYSAPTKGLELKEAVVVRKGTQEGNPTVDLILTDLHGSKYVAMITGALLSSIPCRPNT